MIELQRERLSLKRNSKNIKFAMDDLDDRWNDLYIDWLDNEEDSRISRFTRNACTLLPCSAHRCNKLKGRLNSHILEYHPSQSTVTIEISPPTEDVSYFKKEFQGPTIETIPSENISVQTNKEKVNTDNAKSYKKKSRHKLVEIPLRNLQAQKHLSTTNFYKQHLEDEIIKWYLNIPGATENPKRDFLRFKVIINLIEKLTILSNYVETTDYHNEIIHEIEYCVDVLLMWSTSDKLQRQYFKNHLSRLLLDSVEALNAKWLRQPDKSWYTIADCDLGHSPSNDVNNIGILRDEIAKWIDEKLIIASALESSKHKEFLTDVFANRLIPIVKSAKNNKRHVRTEVRNILDEFCPMIKMPKSGTTYKIQLHTLATDLSDKLRSIEKNYTNNENVCIPQMYDDENNDLNISVNNCQIMEDEFSTELVNILKLTDAPEDTISDITEVLMESMDLVAEGKDQKVVDSIQQLLQKSGELSGVEALSLANTLITNVKASFTKGFEKTFKLHNSLIILTSQEDIVNPFLRNQPLTSTPLLPEQRDIEKLNAEERLYLDKVAKLVLAWLDTTEKPFETNEDKFFKQTIAKDIAGEIKDFVKISQMLQSIEKNSYEYAIHYIIMKASQKYGLFNDPANAPQVIELKRHIMDLATPNLLMPQHGNRQDLANIMAQIMNPKHDLRPDALNIVEDNISVWMNEQPLEIFKNQDRMERNNQLHDVAIRVQKDLEQRKSEGKIKTELAHWLNNMVHPNVDVDRLAEELKDKVMKLPQNKTIGLIAQKKAKAFAGEDIGRDDDNTNSDKQLQQIIEKYIEHNHEVKDPILEGALGNLLMHEFVKLSPIVGKEASEEINTKHFRRELEYIKEITDWFRNLSFYPLMDTVTDRVEFINDLARIIADLEEQRVTGPPVEDYELLLYDNILKYMTHLPLPSYYMPQVMVASNQLKRRIIMHRPLPCCLLPSEDKAIKSPNEVVKLFEGIISELYGGEIGDDQLLREAYLARLYKELRKMINAGVSANAQFIEQLKAVPFPRRESVKRFDTEMRYAAEIADWLHNFPLIPLKSVDEYDTRIRMISELAEKMIQADIKKAANVPDVEKDIDFEIAKWILDLDLQPGKEIVVPVLISQLKRRMEKVHNLDEKSRSSLPVFFQDGSANRTKSQEGDHSNVGAGTSMVKAIDNWSRSLPITEKNKDIKEATKKNISIDILKTVGQLSDDPHVVNNDPLFEELLADHIDATLTNLSKKHPGIDKKKKDLKESILNDVMDAKKRITDISAGDNYKNVLELSIESSIPNPVAQLPSHDPGFELYKHRMAMLWLLENYDNNSNYGAIKYKTKLNQDIDKYADQAQKRNASPIGKSVLFNEIFSSLDKQSPPSEKTIQEEVEKVKIRCEVDEWFKELPLREASGFDDLLQRDQIIEVLAKKLYDIERKKDPHHADEIMRKEILKWIKKSPLLSVEEENLKMYADKLICILKATADQRKCNRGLNKTSEKPKSQSIEISKRAKIEAPPRIANTSQIAGPSGVNYLYPAPPRRNADDLIAATIHNWCSQLPLETDKGNYIRNETFAKVYQLIIDLVTNPTILNNKDLFEHNLNVGIQKIMSDLYGYSEEQSAKNARKAQLVRELSALRPLLKDDLDREGYKQDLKSVVSSLMDETAKHKQIRLDNSVKNQIVDDFVQYSYSKNDASQQIFKEKIKNTVENALKNDNTNSHLDPNLTSDRLITEMAKVTPPSDMIDDEIFKLRMKKDLSDLFKILPENANKEQMKSALAKSLVNLTREGGVDEDKIKAVIDKTIEENAVISINFDRIEGFIDHMLKSNKEHRPLPSRISSPQRPFQPQPTQFAAPSPRPVSNRTYTVQNAPMNIEPNIGPIHQGPSNVLSVPVGSNSGTRALTTAQISAQTENDRRYWRNVENNVRHAEPGRTRPVYCDECEDEYDCEYDLPLCPCDIYQRYYYF